MGRKIHHWKTSARAMAGKMRRRLSKTVPQSKVEDVSLADEMAKLYQRGRQLSRSEAPVLFWVPGGMPLMLHVEGAIAAALKLRGVPVHAVICDGPFRACVKREIKDGMPIQVWGDACVQCKTHTSSLLKDLGIPFSFIGDFVSEAARADLWNRVSSVDFETLAKLQYDDLDVGINARSAVLRYLQGAKLNGNEFIVREYAFSALVCAEAARNAIDKIGPSRVFLSHGTYVDWGPALKTALAHKLPVIAWMASYLNARFYFRVVENQTKIDFHNLSQLGWEILKYAPLTPLQDAALDSFLESRYKEHNSFDMKQLSQYLGNVSHFREKYALAGDKPVWGINAHINWDAVSDYSPMAHKSFDDWILDTMRVALEIPEVQWLLKIHPAEAWDNPASGVQRLIEKNFPALPPHIRVIPAEEEISPLEFFELVDGGITVYGTSGLEMALQGKPVILAGEAHYGQKGFTYDGLTIESYRRLLRQAVSFKPLTDEQRRLARQYAYCFFIQRQVPLPVVKDPNSNWWSFQIDKCETLLPGKDPFVDFICDRIMDCQDFVMDEELVALSNTV